MKPLAEDSNPDEASTARESPHGAATSALAATLVARDAAAASLHDDVKARLFGDGESRHIGRFEVVRPLGRGAMGSVYAARDPELDRIVAVKVLAPGLLTDPEAEPRLRREARALAKLSDPHVVPVYEVGTEAGQLFVAMEHVDGRTLRAWAQQGTRGWRACVDAYLQAARGLAAAHAAGLVHRDFKPDNAMIGDDGRVRVVDFGLATGTAAARPAEQDAAGAGADGPEDASSSVADAAADGATQTAAGQTSDRATDDDLTRTGTVLGTPGYMAPEQFLGQAADAASDQWAWCISLFEALTGRRPVEASSFAELMRKTVDGALDLQLPREVPGWLGAVLRRGLSRAPSDRHPSMQALVSAVERRVRPRWRIAWALGGLGALAAIVVATQRTPPPPPAPSSASPCAATNERAASVWTDEIRERYAGMSPADLPASWMQEELAWLDARMQRWRDAYAAVCETPPDDGAELIRGCLERDLAQLEATVQETIDDGLALPASELLPPLDRCRHEHARRDLAPVPEGKWRELSAIRRELYTAGPTGAARSWAAALSYAPVMVELAVEQAELAIEEGRIADALTELARAQDDAAACGHDRALARLTVLTAVARGLQREREEHAAATERAARALDRVAPFDPALAATGRLRLSATFPEPDHAARLAQLDAAMSAVDRIREDDPQRWLFEREVGAMRVLELTKLGRSEEADAAFVATSERLLSHVEGGDREERLNVLTEQGVMAYTRGKLDRSRELLAQAYAEAVALGSNSYQMLTANNLSFIEGERGDWLAALEHAQTAVAMARRPSDGPSSPEGLPTLLHSQAQILARPGPGPGGLDRCDEARVLLRESLSLDDRPERRVDLAACALILGDHDEAQREAQSAYDALREDALPRRVDALAIVAAAQIATGHATQAAARLDDPKVLVDDPHGRLRRELASALEASGRDPVRVAALRKQAAGAEPDPSSFMTAFDRVREPAP